MSGTETLLPYLKEKKQNNSDEPTIIVDSREANTAAKIVKGLIERGVHIKTATLEKGDYILSDECAVERKTVHDFVYTLPRRYLFEQMVEKRIPTVHAFKRCVTLPDSQVYFVASLPNIGREKAVALLKSYQTPLNVLINVDGWSKTVNGLGPIISNKVQEVLNVPFKELKEDNSIGECHM